MEHSFTLIHFAFAVLLPIYFAYNRAFEFVDFTKLSNSWLSMEDDSGANDKRHYAKNIFVDFPFKELQSMSSIHLIIKIKKFI